MNVEPIHEVNTEDGLCLQYCKWHWGNQEPTYGYRFIWRDESKKLVPKRGQAIIPDGATIFELVTKAMREDWFR